MRTLRSVVGLGVASVVLAGVAGAAPGAAPSPGGVQAGHAAGIPATALVGTWLWLDADEAFPNPGRAVRVTVSLRRGRLALAFPGSPPARATWSSGRRRLTATVRRRLTRRTGLVPVRYVATARRSDGTIRLSGILAIADRGYGGESAMSAARQRSRGL